MLPCLLDFKSKPFSQQQRIYVNNLIVADHPRLKNMLTLAGKKQEQESGKLVYNSFLLKRRITSSW